MNENGVTEPAMYYHLTIERYSGQEVMISAGCQTVGQWLNINTIEGGLTAANLRACLSVVIRFATVSEVEEWRLDKEARHLFDCIANSLSYNGTMGELISDLQRLPGLRQELLDNGVSDVCTSTGTLWIPGAPNGK